MKCSRCGAENTPDSRFCVFCGNPFEAESQGAASENEQRAFDNDESRSRNYHSEANSDNRQQYDSYNGLGSRYDNFGMSPLSDYERENITAKSLGVLSIAIGVISVLFAAFTIFTGVNYAAIAAFVLAVGAVVKAKPGCLKGVKTAAVIISVIAMGLSVVFSFAGNIAFKIGDSHDLQEFYEYYYEDGSSDDFLGSFDKNAGNGEIV